MVYLGFFAICESIKDQTLENSTAFEDLTSSRNHRIIKMKTFGTLVAIMVVFAIFDGASK